MPSSSSSFLLRELRIAPSALHIPLFSLCPCNISLHDPTLLLPVVLLCGQLYMLPAMPLELNTLLMKIPLTLLQSLSNLLLYLHKVNFGWFDADKHMLKRGHSMVLL